MDFYLDPFEFPSAKESTRRSFESYVTSFEDAFSRWGPLELDRDPEDVKRDVFLSVAGEDFLRDLEEILSYPEIASYDVILTSFLSKHSSIEFLLQDTLAFRSLSQRENESIGDFLSRVRIHASLLPSECPADKEHHIWVQVLLGIRSKRLSTEALLEEWTLEDLIAHSEPLDREVVSSLSQTETRVFKSDNGSYYDERALEEGQDEGTKEERGSENVSPNDPMCLEDVFRDADVIPRRKKMCMEEARRVKGLTIVPVEGGKSKELRSHGLKEIVNALSEDLLPSKATCSYGCKDCSETFEDKKQLISHRGRTCKACSICFHSKMDLSHHYNEFHKDSKCSLCSKICPSRSALEDHIGRVHGHQRKEAFRCPFCGSGFPSDKLISQHIKRTHLREREFSCDRCGKRFDTNGLLRRHVEGVHENRIVAICDICSKAFTHVTSYRSHVQRVHEKLRNYSCDICGARFHASGDLLKHKRGVHEKCTDFECDTCSKGFSRNSILQKHIKAIHSNERNFRCTLCPNAYVSKYNLHRHVQETHERVKQKCDLCQKDIAGSGAGNLTKHKKTVHGISPPTTAS